MAKLEKTLTGDFNSILHKIEDGIINGSISASLEDSSDFYIDESILSSTSAYMSKIAIDLLKK